MEHSYRAFQWNWTIADDPAVQAEARDAMIRDGFGDRVPEVGDVYGLRVTNVDEVGIVFQFDLLAAKED